MAMHNAVGVVHGLMCSNSIRLQFQSAPGHHTMELESLEDYTTFSASPRSIDAIFSVKNHDVVVFYGGAR
jgi:hypothetical protein